MKFYATKLCFIGLILLALITTVIAAVETESFRLRLEVINPVTLGEGVTGEARVVLTNVSETSAREIILRLPREECSVQLGLNNQCQAGTLDFGQTFVIHQHIFDPEGVCQSGKLPFLVEFTDSKGMRRTMKVAAVVTTEVAHE